MSSDRRAVLSVALILSSLAGLGRAQSGAATFEEKLISSSPMPGGFGRAVALSGNTAVASDNVGGSASVYVFERNGTTWSEQAQLVTSGASLEFGSSVAVDGDTAVVSDYLSSISGSLNAGAAFIFVRTGTAWSEQGVLTASDAAPGDLFGESVAISGDTVIVGSRVNSSAYVFVRSGSAWSEQAILTNGTQYFGERVALCGDTALVEGNSKVWAFVRNATAWSQQAQLTPSPLGSGFGLSVVISGNTAAVGTGVSAIVFARSGTSWAQQATIPSPLPDVSFAGSSGTTLAVSDYQDRLVVGAWGDNSNAGAAYVFVRSGETWTQAAKLVDPDAAPGDKLGSSVAMSGDTVAAGAPEVETAGGQNDGAVDLFLLHLWTKFETGLGGVSGIPELEGSGSLVAGSSGILNLTHAAPFALSILFVSLADTPTPFKGGLLSAFPIAFQLPVGTFFTGSWTLPWSAWPAGVPSGSELYFQVGVSDASAVKGVAISNLLKATQP